MLSQKKAHSQKGFALLEILVALVLMTITIFGAVKLTKLSLSSSNSTIARQKSIILIDDLFSRMRVDKTTDYIIDTSTKEGISCTSKDDLTGVNDWLRQLDCSIPGARAVVNVDNNKVTATIIWDDRRGKISNALEQDAYKVSLSTVMMK